MSGKEKWWEKGVRFECQGSGKCCVSRGQYGYVYVTAADRKRLAQSLKIPTAQFTRRYCEKSGIHFVLKEPKDSPDCRFLKNNRCEVYHARPTQCRTWPFWPEVMAPKAWAREVASYCPGVGKGKIVSAKEIKKQMKLQRDSDEQTP